MQTFPTVQPSTDERTITTQDIALLCAIDHGQVARKVKTLKNKSLHFAVSHYFATHPVNHTTFDAYTMTYQSAVMLVAHIDIDFLPKFLETASSQRQPVDAIHHDLLFKISIPERWVVEVIKRSYSSVHRSLTTAINRCKGTELEKHWCYRDGERWYTPWFLANAPFAKEDGMAFKGVLTALSETLQIGQVTQKYLADT